MKNFYDLYYNDKYIGNIAAIKYEVDKIEKDNTYVISFYDKYSCIAIFNSIELPVVEDVESIFTDQVKKVFLY